MNLSLKINLIISSLIKFMSHSFRIAVVKERC